MKKVKLAWCVASVLTCAALGINPVYATVDALDLTIVTNITAGTCKVELQDTGSAKIDTVNFQNVYIPEVISKAKVQKFQLAFSGCDGLPQNQAVFTLSPGNGATCDGNGNGKAFANAASTNKAEAVAVEVWDSATPDSGKQIECKAKNSTTVTMTNNAKVFPLSARLVRDSGKADTDVRAGDFNTPAVFNITYQ